MIEQEEQPIEEQQEQAQPKLPTRKEIAVKIANKLSETDPPELITFPVDSWASKALMSSSERTGKVESHHWSRELF